MKDIFDNPILCSKCGVKMQPLDIIKNGFRLRAVQCSKCGEKIFHPVDLEKYKHYHDLKKKNFSVKLRMVGNSYAVSIPKEIVDFMNQQEKIMNKLVNLCFEDFGRLSLNFRKINKLKTLNKNKLD